MNIEEAKKKFKSMEKEMLEFALKLYANQEGIELIYTIEEKKGKKETYEEKKAKTKAVS